MSEFRDRYWSGLLGDDLDQVVNVLPSYKGGFAETTITATMWIICFEPTRLAAWLERHPPGDKLEAIARRRIEENRKQRETEGDGSGSPQSGG